VPYRITAPANIARGNQTILIEPPHPITGLGARDLYLGQDFLFSRGFIHAAIGWSTASSGGSLTQRILDPTVPGIFIQGGFRDGNGRTDDEIIVDFARALKDGGGAEKMVGHVDRIYITGFSDSSDPVLRLVTSGRASGVFDLALPFTAQGFDPQVAIATGLYSGKLIIVNSEADASASLVDRGEFPNQYRFYAVAGTPHIPDTLGIPFLTTGSTPASFIPELRAHFLQGHAWAKGNQQPPASTHLKTIGDGTLDRDLNGNAISVNSSGQLVPRLPFIELGEAHFIVKPAGMNIGSLIGSYEDVKTIKDLGFKSHEAYLQAFKDKLADYVKAGYMTKEESELMLRRASLCAPLTFTETYRDQYGSFVAIIPCSP
jgi:hypothetical protein